MKKLLILLLLLVPATLVKAQFCGPYTNHAPINLTGASGITISGDSINLNHTNTVGITLTNCNNIHITKSRILNSTGNGIYLFNCHDITIDSCYISNVNSGVIASSCTGNIKITDNYFLNMTGPFPRGQAVQFNTVSGGGNKVSRNKIENQNGLSNPEDCINIFKSNGISGNPIRIDSNWVRCDIPTSHTGGGILLGDNGGSWQTATYNILVSPGNYGMGNAGCDNCVIEFNTIYSPQHIISDPALRVSNVALSNHNWPAAIANGAVCNNNVFMNNTIQWWSDKYYDGVHFVSSVNNYWNDGSCTSFGLNTFNAPIDASILPVNLVSNCAVAALTFGPIPAKTYGAGDFSAGASSTAAITYTSANASVAVIISGMVHITGTGTSVITANNGSTSLSQTLTVNKAALTITADNKSKAYGSVNPALTASYSGFVLGENTAALSALPILTTPAVVLSPVGTYAITASGASANNYSFSYVAGTLTVGTVAITFNAIPSKVYGTVDFDPGASSAIGITYTSSNTAVATIVAGKIHIKSVGTSSITADNGSTTQSQTLTVTKRGLTIRAEDKSRLTGIANPSLTLLYSGFVYSDTPASLSTLPTASTTATILSGAGSYAITVSGATSGNYSFTYVPGTLSISKGLILKGRKFRIVR